MQCNQWCTSESMRRRGVSEGRPKNEVEHSPYLQEANPAPGDLLY